MKETSRASRPALTLLALSLWLACDVSAAPAPPPPRAQRARPRLPVRCVLVWRNERYDATFSPCGAYHAEGHGFRWRGTWRLTGRVLEVEERIEGHTGPPVRWRCELCPRLREGPGVRLEPCR